MYKLAPVIGFAIVVLTLSSASKAGIFGNITDPFNAVGQALSTVNQRPNTVAQPAPQLPPSPPTVKVVSPEDRSGLLQAINDTDIEASKNAQNYKKLVVIFSLLAIGTAAASAIATFLRASTVAGICSILATVAIGADSALPYRKLADLYDSISVATHALLQVAKLTPDMTYDDYLLYRDKLTAIVLSAKDTSETGSKSALADVVATLIHKSDSQRSH